MLARSTIALPGYQLTEQIYVGSRTLVYRAVRAADHQPVVIKLLKNEHPSFSELVQFRNQYTIAKHLNAPGIIRHYCLEPYHNGYALIMEDFGGISLSQHVRERAESRKHFYFPLTDFLAIALQLCNILQELYQQRVIHKDIKPANILIDSDKQVKLIDFSIASLLPRETPEIQSPNVLEGTLAYLSPEQTGRMNRGIDYRSDFYSLGVTFYELLTGQLPFVVDDPMELIHCHIAKHPPSVNSLNPEIPPVLAAIVSKLMAKNAENRYQSTFGLKHDLERLAQWQQTGRIEFAIGQRDVCDRFLIPETLHGRHAEVQMLLDAFERVSQGSNEVMLVAGFSGIGKTAVVNEVHTIVRQRGYFIKGKFDQFQRNIPLSAFVQAFRDLMGQLLRASDRQLEQWKTNILAALGENAQVIIDVIPELERIIGPQPPAPDLSGSAAQARFDRLLQQLIQVFATPDHPLVIFIDDLQWADSASLNLMRLLLGKANRHYLLFIGAYRNNEVTLAHPLMLSLDEMQQSGATVNTMTLAPLTQASVNQLVAATLSCSLTLASPLTALIVDKTSGNPFFTTQLLKALYDDRLITFNRDENYWECDLAQVRSLTIADDVVAFMATQLQKLPAQTQAVLKLAACIGNQFDLNTLAIISEQTAAETAAVLWKALQEGLVIPQGEVYKFYQGDAVLLTIHRSPLTTHDCSYKFLHDRVQQAAYSLIPDEQKQHTQLQIGRLLLQNTPTADVEANIFEIVGHWNQAIEAIATATETAELARLNLLAGRKAKASAAYPAALSYLQLGIRLLNQTAWCNQYELTLQLHDAAADAAYLSGEFAVAEQLIETILTHARSYPDRVKGYEVRLTGNLQFGGYALMKRAQYLYLVGQELTQVRQEMVIASHALTATKQGNTLPWNQSFEQAVLNLLEQSDDPCRLVGTAYDETRSLPQQLAANDRTGLHYVYLNKLILGYLFGQYQSAADNAARAESYLDGVLGFLNGYVFCFYDSLTQMALYGAADDAMRAMMWAKVQANQAQMQLWASHAPMNFQHKYDLVEAERCRVLGQKADAIDLYDRAIALAIEHKYLNEAALANELAAKFYLNWGKERIAQEYITDAYYGYARWGAKAKVVDLEQRYPQLLAAVLQQERSLNSPRKQAERQLQQSQQLLQLVLNTIPHKVFWKDVNLVYQGCNYSFADVAGVGSPTEIVGKTDYDLAWTTEEADFFRECDRRVMESNTPEIGIIEPQLQADATAAWLETSKLPLHDVDGRVIGLLGIYQNITDRLQAERQLQESQRFLQLLLDNIPQLVLWKDRNSVFQGCNAIAVRRWGLESSADLVGKTDYDFSLTPEEAAWYQECDRRVMDAGQPELHIIETQQQADGSQAWLDTNKIPLRDSEGNVIGILVAIEDISERKHTEAELRESQYRLSWLIQQSPMAIIEWDNELRVRSWNLAAERIFGFTAAEAVGQQLAFLIPEGMQLNVAQLLSQPGGSRSINKNLTKSGNVILCDWYNSSVVNEAGEVIGAASMALDITEARRAEDIRRQAEATLQEQEQFLRSIYNGAEMVIFVADVLEDGTFSYAGWNAATERVTGISSAAIVGKTLTQVWGNEQGEVIRQRFANCVSKGMSIFFEENLTFNGQETWWFSNLNPLKNVEGRVHRLIGTTFDISDRKRAEAQLKRRTAELEQTLQELQRTQTQMVQSEKMSGLGQLVAGVAHEINNPVNFIYGNLSHAADYTQELLRLLQLYQQHYPTPHADIQHEIEAIDLEFLTEDLQKLLTSMKVGADRIRTIVASLRNFSRMDEADMKEVNIHEGLDSTLLILQHRLKAKMDYPKIEVIKAYGKLPLVECYAGQLNQVFMNLLSNAIDALEESLGKGEKRKGHGGAPTPTITIHTALLEHQQVAIQITDNGVGIPDRVKQRLFDPFFTTKPVGKGTGMGLSISYQIVTDRHKGTLQFVSTLGEGATFTITIPIQQR